MSVDLETRLQDLAETLHFPGEEQLVARVVDRLSPDRAAPVVPLHRRPLVRRMVAVAAAAALIATVVLVASPRARHAMADLLGIGGVEVRGASSASTSATTSPPTFPRTLVPGQLGLGTAVSLADGARRLGVAGPVPRELGRPDAVFFGEPPPGGELTLVWKPAPGLPSTRIPDVGALLTVFRGGLNESYFLKILDPNSTYERVTVNSHPAAWLAGQPHAFLYQDERGNVQRETLRLAGNTLIWTNGPFTYRLESALERDGAIAVAESVPV
jgi:hypothetical protein